MQYVQPLVREAIADQMNLKKPDQLLPYWLAGTVVRVLRWQGERAVRRGGKAILTPAQYKFMLLNLDFSIEKAKRELGYQPRYTFDEGIRETIAWYGQKG